MPLLLLGHAGGVIKSRCRLLRCISPLTRCVIRCDALFLVALGGWSQPIDATLIENRKDIGRVLISEKCRLGLTAARETGSFGIAGSWDLESD